MRDALLLLAHGSREPAWAGPVRKLRDCIKEQLPAHSVALAYLENMSPSLSVAVDELVALGARRIRVLPLFLGQGSHLRRDLPVLVASARIAHAAVTIELMPAIGEQEAILDMLAHAIARTLG